MLYCEKCRGKYDLNERSMKLFNEQCVICGVSATCNSCHLTKMSVIEGKEIIKFSKVSKVKLENGRFVDALSPKEIVL